MIFLNRVGINIVGKMYVPQDPAGSMSRFRSSVKDLVTGFQLLGACKTSVSGELSSMFTWQCPIDVHYIQPSKCPVDNWAHQVVWRDRGLEIPTTPNWKSPESKSVLSKMSAGSGLVGKNNPGPFWGYFGYFFHGPEKCKKLVFCLRLFSLAWCPLSLPSG